MTMASPVRTVSSSASNGSSSSSSISYGGASTSSSTTAVLSATATVTSSSVPLTTTSSINSSVISSSSQTFAQQQQVPPIWEWSDGTMLEEWMQRTLSRALPPGPGAAHAAPPGSSGSLGTVTAWQRQTAALLWKNLSLAVREVKLIEYADHEYTLQQTASDGSGRVISSASLGQEDDDDDDNEEGEGEDGRYARSRSGRPKKKVKRVAPKKKRFFLQDKYRVWKVKKSPKNLMSLVNDPAVTSSHVSPTPASQQQQQQPQLDLFEWSEDQEDLPECTGGKLAQLTTGGILNGMALIPQGLTHNISPTLANIKGATEAVPSAADCTRAQLWQVAVLIHRALEAKVQEDVLRTTPLRIQQMLAADLQPSELTAIRKRIYDTVILDKGRHTHDGAAEDDDEANLPVAASMAVSDVEKFKKCPNCGNNDQSAFALDRKNGDVICYNCGVVVAESIMHEGSQYRKFEGEADRNHHGDPSNPLYSNAHNMGTSLSGVAPVTGAGIGGWGSSSASTTSGSKRNLETILRNAHAYTEMNVSQFGKTDRRTRVGYKDRQKKEAFVQMSHVGDALNLHEAVVQRAKELFAGFRDDRELVQQFKGVLAACLCEAFAQLSSEGHAILKLQQQIQPEAPANTKDKSTATTTVSARAARRNELHHITLAGKGGLLLDFSNVAAKKEGQPTNQLGPSATGAVHSSDPAEKPVATWDLEDCRSWLLSASRRIAQQWVDERLQGDDKNKNNSIPKLPLEELEGQLVEHSIRLCEQLEAELQNRRQAGPAVNRAQRKTATPRVSDMSKLGIKWQHSHERGSGGKGGVGGSGNTKSDVGPTAGQILILKTAKKLGSILNDDLAGEAFHKELRAVVEVQEAKKRKEKLDEASRQRLQQMKRKPWLQARVDES